MLPPRIYLGFKKKALPGFLAIIPTYGINGFKNKQSAQFFTK